MTDISRETLIELCELAIVDIERWNDRDCPSTHEKIGQLWAMLKAGCDYSIAKETDANTIWVEYSYPNFMDFENRSISRASRCSEKARAYLPTYNRLAQAKGEDWY